MDNANIGSDERLDVVNDDIKIIQKKSGLTFGTDAYLLSCAIKGGKMISAAELGAGTGIISLLLLARGKIKSAYAVEIQPEFSSLISRNAELNGFGDRLFPINRDLRELTADDVNGPLPLVYANPPYMNNNSGFENSSPEKNIARREVFGGISDFCAAAARLLKFGGRFVCVYRPERLADLLCGMRENKIEPKKLTFICPYADSAPSLLLAEGIYGGKSQLKISKPLVIYKDRSKSLYTDEFASIYRTGSYDFL